MVIPDQLELTHLNKKRLNENFTEKLKKSFDIGVDDLIIIYYTKGNLFLTKNGDRAPRT